MTSGDGAAKPPRRRRRRRAVWIALAVLVAAVGAFRLWVPSIARGAVLRALAQDPVYRGEIGDVTIHLWRGAYSIENVRILKTTGSIPVPFFSARRLDLSLKWGALLHGRLVGRFEMDSPELNLVDAADEADAQTGAGAPWLKMFKDLFPLRIDGGEVTNGSIHFRTFHTTPAVDVYLSKVKGTLADLTNVNRDVTPLFASVHATALAMDQAKVEFEMRIDPTAYRPTFHLAARMLGLDVRKTNALVRAYGRFDFEAGRFDLVVELDAKEGALRGYVKPLFRDLAVVDLAKDVRNPLVLFWEALVGTAITLFKNQARDQLATVVPLSGDLDAPRSDFFVALGNVLRNAFVRAYLPTLQGTAPTDAAVTFGTGTPVEPEPQETSK